MWLRPLIAVAVVRPAAAGPVQSLAWELLPHVAGAALKGQKKRVHINMTNMYMIGIQSISVEHEAAYNYKVN